MKNSNYIFSRSKLGLDRRVWRTYFITLLLAVLLLIMVIWSK